jgi:hypothetical protein
MCTGTTPPERGSPTVPTAAPRVLADDAHLAEPSAVVGPVARVRERTSGGTA